MSKRILVEKGYTVPDKYIELEDCEVVCDKCKGTGRYRAVYGPPGGWDGMIDCPDCGGEGKRLQCVNCGELEYHGLIKHEKDPSLDGLCYRCLKAELHKRGEI